MTQESVSGRIRSPAFSTTERGFISVSLGCRFFNKLSTLLGTLYRNDKSGQGVTLDTPPGFFNFQGANTDTLVWR